MAASTRPLDEEHTPTVQRLVDSPRSERHEALESVVIAEFKATLLMPEDEDLPQDVSYFELGFTSLRITEVKQRLEEQLGRPISTSTLFARPTVVELLDHLETEVFPDLFGRAAAGTDEAPSREQVVWDAVLDDLYQG